MILFSSDQRNTDAPPDSIAHTAFNLQGYFGSWLATPIGPHHIVTARHPFGTLSNNTSSAFFFHGLQYNTDPTFNGTGYAADPNSDLLVFRVNETLPAWATLYTSNDEQNRHLVTVGRGVPRGEAVVVDGVQKGWRWDVATYDGVVSWGENEVAGTPNVGMGIGEVLQFDFGARAGTVGIGGS